MRSDRAAVSLIVDNPKNRTACYPRLVKGLCEDRLTVGTGAIHNRRERIMDLLPEDVLCSGLGELTLAKVFWNCGTGIGTTRLLTGWLA